MAININRVYQTVLALANKEQRGYITPQEFNLFAHQAQMSIFEQYFYDLDQFKRMAGSEIDHNDSVKNIEKKIDSFLVSVPLTSSGVAQQLIYTNSYPVAIHALPSNIYRIAEVRGGTGQGDVERLSMKKFNQAMSSYLTRPSKKRPAYYVRGTEIIVAPDIDVNLLYIRAPYAPKWTYIVVNEKPIYVAASDKQDFEIDASDENKLVLKILQLAGVAIEDFNLVQAAGTAEVNTVAQQKQ